MVVVLSSVAVLLGWGMFWLIRDARRQTRRSNEFFSELRMTTAPVDAPAPVSITWSSADDRDLLELLQTGE